MYQNVLFNLNDKKELLIEVLTSFYGQNYKELIEYKFNKIVFINSYDFFSLLNSIEDEETYNKLDKFEELTIESINNAFLKQFPGISSKFLYENNFTTFGLFDYFNYEEEGDFYNSKKIEYFKTIGIDLGEDYNSYKNSTLAQSKIPPKVLLNKISEIRQQLLKEYDSILNRFASSYFEIIRYLKENNLENQIKPDKVMQYIIDIEPKTVVCHKNNNIFPIIFINCLDDENSFGDRGLLHEINHGLSLKPLHIGKKSFNYQFGFISYFECNNTNNNFEEEEELDGSEMFNECINDLISIDLLNIAKEKNLVILNQVERKSIYENLFPLIKPFYEEFKDDIKHFYLTEELKSFYKKINKRDFYKLVDIVCEANEYVNSLKENELIDLNDYIKESNSIVEKMKNKKIKRTI